MRKFIDVFVSGLFIIGVVIFLGAPGTVDYKLTIGEDYNIGYTLLTMLVGVLFMLPAVTRYFYGRDEEDGTEQP